MMEEILQKLTNKRYSVPQKLKLKCLDGVRPDLLKKLSKKVGHRTRVYLTYGSEWYLYVCHRLAKMIIVLTKQNN